jgi:hypothetical protein
MQGLLASRGYGLSGMVQDLDEGDPEMFYSKKLATRSCLTPVFDKSACP